MEDMGAILRGLPPEGEVTKLGAPAQRKVDAVRRLLTATRRDWYEIKVIDVPQAAIGLHARAVVLISAPAIALVNAAELQRWRLTKLLTNTSGQNGIARTSTRTRSASGSWSSCVTRLQLSPCATSEWIRLR